MEGKIRTMNCDFYMPTEIVSGKNCVLAHSHYFAVTGSKCLIVTGASSAKRSGALADVITGLGQNNVEYIIFDGIGQNPTFAQCLEAAEVARKSKAEFLIGIGGGSPLDATKAIAALALYPGMDEQEAYSTSFTRVLPYFLIGTTAGTGSEVTRYAILTNSNNEKKNLSSPLFFAKASFCDPRYTYSLPEQITISTALDALAHAMESYFSKRANEISDLYALRALKLTSGALFAIQEYGFSCVDEAMRDNLYMGSILAGLAINNTGTLFPHPLGYPLSEEYGVPHGTACGVYSPALLDWCMEHSKQKALDLLAYLGLGSMAALTNMIKGFVKVDITMNSGEIERIAQRSKSTSNFANTPGEFGVKDATAILNNIFLK